MLAAQGGFLSVRCWAACAEVDCVWGSHSAAALLDHISLRVHAILFVGAKKLVMLRMRPPLLIAPLRRVDEYPRKLMVSGLMENLFFGP